MKKLKILITAYDFRPMLGGIATFADEVCQVLTEQRDIEIRLITREMKNSFEFDQKQKFKIKRVSMSRRSEFSIFAFSTAIKNEISDWQPDAILNFLWLPESVATFLTAKKIPYFIIAHGVELLESRQKFRKKIRAIFSPLKKKIFKSSTHVLTNSNYTKQLVEKFCGVSAEKISCIFAGVSTQKFTPGQKSNSLIEKYSLNGKKVLMTITRLVDYKGIDYVLLSLKEILKVHPDLVYLIAGEGEDEFRLKKMVRDLGLESSVIFIGKIDDQQLVDHYRLCDLFIMLSREDYVTPNVEGFGLVYLEASACEKPVIGGKSGGVVDAIEDQVSGMLVNPTDPREIAFVVSGLLSDPKKMTILGIQGRKRVISQFNWNKISDNILAVMKENLKIV